MRPVWRSLVVLGVHVALVLTLVVRYGLDRVRYPSAWFAAQPYDPNLPIRGRYVPLRLVGLPKENDTGLPVAFFISEHVPDPSRRAPGEQLGGGGTAAPRSAAAHSPGREKGRRTASARSAPNPEKPGLCDRQRPDHWTGSS